MRKLILISAIFLAFCSCARPMTNDEILFEAEKCAKAGFGATQIKDLYSMRTTGVECRLYPEKYPTESGELKLKAEKEGYAK